MRQLKPRNIAQLNLELLGKVSVLVEGYSEAEKRYNMILLCPKGPGQRMPFPIKRGDRLKVSPREIKEVIKTQPAPSDLREWPKQEAAYFLKTQAGRLRDVAVGPPNPGAESGWRNLTSFYSNANAAVQSKKYPTAASQTIREALIFRKRLLRKRRIPLEGDVNKSVKRKLRSKDKKAVPDSGPRLVAERKTVVLSRIIKRNKRKKRRRDNNLPDEVYGVKTH